MFSLSSPAYRSLLYLYKTQHSSTFADPTGFENIGHGGTIIGQVENCWVNGIVIGKMSIFHAESVPGGHLNSKDFDDYIC
jgi:hypothetical protein